MNKTGGEMSNEAATIEFYEMQEPWDAHRLNHNGRTMLYNAVICSLSFEPHPLKNTDIARQTRKNAIHAIVDVLLDGRADPLPPTRGRMAARQGATENRYRDPPHGRARGRIF